MPVIDRRTGVTGLPDSVIKQLVGTKTTVLPLWRNPFLIRVSKSDVDQSRVTNPTHSASRVQRGLYPELYRPGGLLYRP